VLDFVGNSGRHRLVSSPDVLGGDHDLDDIAGAKEAMAASGGAEDIEQAIGMAKAQRELREAKEEARREEEEATRRQLRASATYHAVDVDPFGGRGYRPGGVGSFNQPASRKQVDYLIRLGVSESTAEGYTKGQAGAIIDQLTSATGPAYVMRFGKHKGKRLGDIPRGYLSWARDNISHAELGRHIDETLGG
jgi:uncharacterized protein (DUF3820 family)